MTPHSLSTHPDMHPIQRSFAPLRILIARVIALKRPFGLTRPNAIAASLAGTPQPTRPYFPYILLLS